jgi:dual specificity MAP kinase phosphatase
MVTCETMRRAYGLSDAVEVVPGLFVGSVVDGMDDGFLDAKDIRFVVNCTKEKEETAGMQIPVDDDLTFDQDRVMYRHLPRAVAAIAERLDKRPRENVLVHCFAGQQRSAAVACAFLIDKRGATLDAAIARIRKKKPDAFRPGVNFERALLDFESDVMFRRIL